MSLHPFNYLITLLGGLLLCLPVSAQSLPSSLEEQAGIWLDLAIYQCEQGDREEAMRLLNIIELEFLPPAGIQKVITYLREEGCYIGKKPKFKLSLSTGWSDNVNQGPSHTQFILGPGQLTLELAPSSRPQSDFFAAVEGEWYAAQSPDLSWQLSFYGSAKQYRQQEDFNQQLLGVTLVKSFRTQAWQWEWRTIASTATLGQQHFQDTVFTGLTVLRAGWLAESQWGYQQFPAYSDYNAMIAIQRVGYQYAINPRSLVRARLNYTIDEAQAQRPGGNRVGKGWDLMGSHIINNRLKTDIVLRFDDNRSNNIYYPGYFDMKRHQRWSELRWNWLYLLGANDGLQLQLFHNQVRDSVPILAFKQSGINLSWFHLFR